MVKYGDVILKFYQIIKDFQKHSKEKTNQEQKQPDLLGEFKTLLLTFLNDDTNTNDHETPDTSTSNVARTDSGGLKGLRLGVTEILSAGEIWNEKINILSSSKISSTEILTLMQFVSAENLPEFLQILLDEGLDPNYPVRSEENDNDESLPPVLLAAKKGHSEILKKLKQHNFTINADAKLIVIDELEDMNRSGCCGSGKNENEMQSIRLKSMDMTKEVRHPCNFSVWSSHGETVLHLLLKEPEAKRSKGSGNDELTLARNRNLDEECVKIKEKRRKTRQQIRENYEKCLDVILSTEAPSQFHEKQIKLIINKKERNGRKNTALHYALDGKWKSSIIKKLLNHGADLLATNQIDEKAISKVPPQILESFLDDYCMNSIGYGTWDKDGKWVPPDDSNVEDDFGVSIATSPVSFKYTFLAPDLVTGGRREDISYIKDSEKRVQSRKLIPETKVLLAISESPDPDIRKLVQHPVIKSYTWLKWKQMRTYFNRNIRIRCLLTICITWFIFSNYGGTVWNQDKLIQKLTNKNYSDVSDGYEFCNNRNFSFNSLLEHSNNRYSKDWYILFATHALFQLVYIALDIRTQVTARYYSKKNRVREGSTKQSLVTACAMDIFVFVLIVIVLIGADEILWFVITILLLYQCLKEYVQIVSSFPDYFFHLDNYFDIIQIGTICFLLFYPNQVRDTNKYSVERNSEDEEEWSKDCRVKRSLAALTILFTFVRLLMSIARHPKLERCSIYFMMFYRVTGSFLKFLFWYSSFILAFGLGFYIIFHDDTKLEAKKMKHSQMNNHSIRNELNELIGNYIIRNETYENGTHSILINFDPPKEKDDREDADETRFDVPYVALMRTSVMFIGEIDFTDLPINGGNISKTFVYLFLLCFIFLMVMVLMNLLNGMAVSDTGQILNEAVILSHTKFIETLAYFETVAFDNYEWQKMCFSAFPLFQYCIKNRMSSSGILLFHSALIGENQTISLPFELDEKDKTTCPATQSFIKAVCKSDRPGKMMDKLKDFFLYKENQGSELFLKEARKRLLEIDYYKRHKDMIPKRRYRESSLTTWEHGREKLGFDRATRLGSDEMDYSIEIR